ncbi:MAG: hypothetical protein AAF618_10775, partial [Pseudomonadota bacterium]
LVFGVIASTGGGASPGTLAVLSVLGIGYVLLMIWAFTRLSMVLPAASIGRTLTLPEAWQATEPLGGAILGAVMLVGLFGVVLQVLAAVFIFAPILLVVASGAASLIGTLLSVSLATTIYGVAVERRELT